MKNLISKSLIIFMIFISQTGVLASDNILNTVLLEKTDNSYNVILRADYRTNVSKKVKSDGDLELTIKDIHAESTVPILYRNVPSQSSVVISNNGRGEVKLHISSDGISKSNVIFETPNASPVKVNNNHMISMILAGLAAISALMYANRISSRKLATDLNFDLNIKDREMKLLKKYREELTTIPSINSSMRSFGYTGKMRDITNNRVNKYAQKV